MLKVAIIGAGNAGNQIAELGKKERNIPGLAINSSAKDISTLKCVDKLIIGDEKGAGKDRNVAKGFMKSNIETLLKKDFVKKLIEENEVIFMVSSAGGGTGSGEIPVLTNILSKLYPLKKFIMVNILPPLNESVAAQENTIDYLKEMQMFNPTYMSYDNNRFANLPTKQMMEKINEEIIEDICIIRGDYQYSTPYNSIDEKDMLKIISAPGRLTIAKAYDFKEKDLDDKTVEDLLIQNIKSTSGMTELERDKIVRRLGLITNLPEKIQNNIDTNLKKLKEFVGEPLEGFEHVYYNTGEETNKALVLLSGLSIPDDRISKILQRIEEVTEMLTKRKESSLLDETEGISFLKELRNEDIIQDSDITTQVDIADIFNQFM